MREVLMTLGMLVGCVGFSILVFYLVHVLIIRPNEPTDPAEKKRFPYE